MVNDYKGKGDALKCGSCRDIRPLEHAIKVLERVIEGRLKKFVKIDNMFGFMAGRSMTCYFQSVARVDWVSAYRNVEVVGEKSRGRGRKTWRECVNDDMEVLGL